MLACIYKNICSVYLNGGSGKEAWKYSKMAKAGYRGDIRYNIGAVGNFPATPFYAQTCAMELCRRLPHQFLHLINQAVKEFQRLLDRRFGGYIYTSVLQNRNWVFGTSSAQEVFPCKLLPQGRLPLVFSGTARWQQKNPVAYWYT